MKKALLAAVAAILVISALAIGYLSTLEGPYSVSRSIEIDAPAILVSNVVADFNTWPSWSPWLNIDPTAVVKISGSGRQQGNIFSWNGEMIGSGEMEHLYIEPGKNIAQEIRFNEPFKTSSKNGFHFAPSANGVTVTWEMKGKMPFFFRFLTKKIKPLIGMDFERGLKMLKEFAETGKVSSNVSIKGIQQFGGLTFLGKNEMTTMDNLPTHMEKTFYEVSNWLVSSNTFPDEGISLYKSFDYAQNYCEYTSGYRLSDSTKTFPFPAAQTLSIPSGKTVKVTFHGHYQHLANAWSAAYMFIQKHNLEADADRQPFEVYLNDPVFFPNPSDWVTEVYIPIQ